MATKAKGKKQPPPSVFSSDEEVLLQSIRNWVEDEVMAQEQLLRFYTSTAPAPVKHAKPPFPDATESLATIERQLANISADQATVAVHYGAVPSSPPPMAQNPSRKDALYTIVLWHLYLSGGLKSILKAETGNASSDPKKATTANSKPGEESLAWIVSLLDKSSADLKQLLVRQNLAAGPTPVPPTAFPSIDQSLSQIELWWAAITQNVLSVAATAPRRGLGGKPSFPH